MIKQSDNGKKETIKRQKSQYKQEKVKKKKTRRATLKKSDLSSVHVFNGVRKRRPCLTGHPVFTQVSKPTNLNLA